MPKAQDYHLTKAGLKLVETAIKHDKRPEVVQRSMAIRLLHLGHKPEEVAKIHAVSKPTIYGWFARWQSGGVEALANQPKSGRPPKADDAYSLALVEVIEKEPSEVGYNFTIWTVERLSAHLEKITGIALSESRLRALIKRKGYRYRRPKHDLGHLQDKQAKAKAAEVLVELKKRSAETISNSSLWTKRP
jgi:transposase